MGKDVSSFGSTMESMFSNLLSPHCYEELILKQHFFDLGCNKMLLSKMLGYAILVGSLLVKFPQIVKIKWNKSGAGVSVLAESIMLAAIFGSMAYGYTSEFPLSAYGDSYFLFIQTILVILLVLYYQRKYLAAVGYLGEWVFLSRRSLHWAVCSSSMHISDDFNVSEIAACSIGWSLSWSISSFEFNQSILAILLHLQS